MAQAATAPVRHSHDVDLLSTPRPHSILFSSPPQQPCSSYSHSPHYVYLTSLRDTRNVLASSQPFHTDTPFSSHPASPRSCVHSFPAMADVDSAHAEAFPGSPPDLSESKSSKSSGSSFRSSCLTDATGQENLSHFEDIALADSGRDLDDIHSHHVDLKHSLNRPPQRRAASATVQPRTGGNHHGEVLRDTTNTTRPRYPSLKTHVTGVEMGRNNFPTGRSIRRGFASPSAPNIATMAARGRDSRSPSPDARVSSGSRSPRSATSASHSFANNYKAFGRRQSWQPGRKTVKELEDEYHDSDEEVPDDAVIWNVPISPRPPFQASNPASPKRSISQSRLGNGLPNIGKHDPARAAGVVKENVPSLRSPKRPEMPHSATVGMFPIDALVSKPRTKSWTNDLSDEARELSVALEAYAENVLGENSRSVTSSAANSPPRPAMKLRSKTSIMELPPVQKGNIMIDPLPISKEKEAVLARTRPSWLPPKCPKEEKRHLKQWEKMMAQAADVERRRAAKEREEQMNKKEVEGSLARIWEQHVLPHWDAVIREPRTRELWWRGVTARSRGAVWSKAIGNELSLSEASYTAALNRARAIQTEVASLPSEERSKHADSAWLSAIERDVPTVFAQYGIFSAGAPLHDALKDVLLAYSAYRSDVGYVYGTHVIAGLLVLNLSASGSFIALANLLNRPLPLAFLVQDNSSIQRIHDLVLATLRYKMPKLHAHLTDPKTDISLEEWLTPFLSTLGAMHLTPETCSRVWDITVFEGDKTLIRTVVGVLSLLESKLYGDRDEILCLIGWGAPVMAFTEDEVVSAVREAGKTEKRS
ncbi:hypothetical protein MBLNU459_g0229t1 [Dothideomycetes sp. NU459]